MSAQAGDQLFSRLPWGLLTGICGPMDDEGQYRQRCIDLCFDWGYGISREGECAVLDLGYWVSSKPVLCIPVHQEHFWREAWTVLRAYANE